MTAHPNHRHTWLLTAVVLFWTPPAEVGADNAVYQKTVRSTCWIVTRLSDTKTIQGTGLLVDKERRQVLTNDHVVAGSKEVTVYFPIVQQGVVIKESRRYPGTGIPARVLKVDGKRDLALLQLSKLPYDVQTLPLSERSAELGQAVHSIGNSSNADKPLFEGSLWHYREGKVAGIGFKVIKLTNTGGKIEARIVQSTSGTRHGDSGGPVVDGQGRLVGVVSCGRPGSEVSNFIDIQEVRGFLKDFRAVSPKPASPVEGTWTLRFPRNGTNYFLGLTLQKKGTLLVDDGSKSWNGRYTYNDGKLLWEVPGMNIRERVSLAWQDDNQFRFTSGSVELVCTRR